MENKAESKKTILFYGLLTGGASILITLISYAMGNVVNPNILLKALSFVLPITLIVLGIRSYKSKNNGHLTWGQAVKIGVGISVIWGLLSLIFGYILEVHIDPSIMEQQLQFTVESLQKWGVKEDMIEETIRKTKESQASLTPRIMGLLFFIFGGFVISAIAGAIMKKDTNDVNFN